jgi:hypothetical protein
MSSCASSLQADSRIGLEHFWERDETGFDGIWTGSNHGSQIGVRHQLRNCHLLYRSKPFSAHLRLCGESCSKLFP